MGLRQQALQQQLQQQQRQAQSVLPRVGQYSQGSHEGGLLGFQQYRPDGLDPPSQQPGLALGIHHYQQHSDGLMHFQHQPGLSAPQIQQQALGGGTIVGGSLEHHLQGRGEYYSHEHNSGAASQPAGIGLPLAFSQVRCNMHVRLAHCLTVTHVLLVA